MEIHELVIEMKLLERRLSLYEENMGSSMKTSTTPLSRANWNDTTNTTKRARIIAAGKVSMKPGGDARTLTKRRLSNASLRILCGCSLLFES